MSVFLCLNRMLLIIACSAAVCGLREAACFVCFGATHSWHRWCCYISSNIMYQKISIWRCDSVVQIPLPRWLWQTLLRCVEWRNFSHCTFSGWHTFLRCFSVFMPVKPITSFIKTHDMMTDHWIWLSHFSKQLWFFLFITLTGYTTHCWTFYKWFRNRNATFIVHCFPGIFEAVDINGKRVG